MLIKFRFIARNQAEGERALEYLERLLPGLRLSLPRKGNNPKYAMKTEVLSYGDMEIPDSGPMPRRREPGPGLDDRRPQRRSGRGDATTAAAPQVAPERRATDGRPAPAAQRPTRVAAPPAPVPTPDADVPSDPRFGLLDLD